MRHADSLCGHLLAANQDAQHFTAAEAEPILTGPNNTWPSMPHHLDRHSLAQAHFFQAAGMLSATCKLVNLSELAGLDAVEGNQFVGVCSIYQGWRFY